METATTTATTKTNPTSIDEVALLPELLRGAVVRVFGEGNRRVHHRTDAVEVVSRRALQGRQGKLFLLHFHVQEGLFRVVLSFFLPWREEKRG